MHPIWQIAATSLLAISLLAGCKKEHSGSAPIRDSGAHATSPAPASSPARDAGTAKQADDVGVSSKDDLLQFDYRWPTAAAAIPPLDMWLRDQAAKRREKAMTSARGDFDDARKNGYPFTGRSFSQRWSVVADTPALLVMQADGYTYTGGAHGNPFVASLIWDKARQTRLSIDTLFSPEAMAMALHDRFCAALDRERARKRSAQPGAKPPTIPEFSRCVDMTHQEMLPISKSGKALDAIRVVIMPYEAGPYSEGIYTIELPLDDSALKAVQNAYKAAFAKP